MGSLLQVIFRVPDIERRILLSQAIQIIMHRLERTLLITGIKGGELFDTHLTRIEPMHEVCRFNIAEIEPV